MLRWIKLVVSHAKTPNESCLPVTTIQLVHRFVVTSPTSHWGYVVCLCKQNTTEFPKRKESEVRLLPFRYKSKARLLPSCQPCPSGISHYQDRSPRNSCRVNLPEVAIGSAIDTTRRSSYTNLLLFDTSLCVIYGHGIFVQSHLGFDYYLHSVSGKYYRIELLAE
ncbi:hypothetical protein K501DRAFT_268396 [Backusella circina FSU 941]|nr:hypothetical protein K501DRAFT_268396 [Backusella circina FSU 941]